MNLKQSIIVVAAAIIFGVSPAYSQKTGKVIIPLDIKSRIPQATEYLSEHVGFDDPLFVADSIMYERGKELRPTDRGALAISDAEVSVRNYLERFGAAMCLELTPETYPVTTKYILTSFVSARKSIQTAKDKFARQRPYQHFGEPSLTPEDDRADDYTSYPSGHTIRAWAIALALVAIDPEHQADIIRVGLEMGDSRVISGHHYQSDVDAARLCAAVTYAAMSSDPEYQELQKAAREEIAGTEFEL